MNILSHSQLGGGSYVTYPHCNGFAEGGDVLVYLQPTDASVEVRGLELKNGRTYEIQRVEFTGPRPPLIWFDVAAEASLLSTTFDNKAWCLDLTSPQDWVCVYEPGPTVRLHHLTSLSSDGQKLLLGETRDDSYAAVEVDLSTGRHRTLFTQGWLANHFHYCPHDEAWIGFSHEGPDVADRCWAWHPQLAPSGIPVFDQTLGRGELALCVGHERWGFHDLSAYAVAYAVSPTGPRGLYETFADGRAARLLWESDVAWHVNMDRTGRFALADTTGPWVDGRHACDEHRIHRERHLEAEREMASRESQVILLDLDRQQSLVLASAIRSQHPYHPHPAFSPDGRWVAWTDLERGACIAGVSLRD